VSASLVRLRNECNVQNGTDVPGEPYRVPMHDINVQIGESAELEVMTQTYFLRTIE
jgi:hypothetical protein